MTLFENYEMTSMGILFIGCILMLFGFSCRKNGWAPWVMLLGVCISLGIIAFNILKHTHVAFT